MSALARLALAEGAEVSGSDRDFDAGRNVGLARKLQRLGIRLHPQDGSGVRADTAAVIYSTAVEPENPDRLAARSRGVQQRHRSELLWDLMSSRRTVAVAGSCGKTTVAAMVAHGLVELDRRPLAAVGGVVRAWETATEPGNALVGGGDWAVFEADESDASLLRYCPEVAVVGPLEADHFPPEETLRLFRDFVARVTGTVVLSPAAAAALGSVRQEACARRVVPEYRLVHAAGGWRAEWEGCEIAVPVPGRFNVENAVLAATVLQALGVAPEEAAATLRRFSGVRRRLELAGTTPSGIRVYDDYAHNPTKIAAAWTAVREAGARQVLGIWQPHGYRPLAGMFSALVETFPRVMSAGDRLYLLPVYYVGGTAEKTVSSGDLAARLASKVHVELASREELPGRLSAAARPGDAVLLMGARDPELSALAAAIVEALLSREG